MRSIGPCPWFNGSADAAATFHLALLGSAKWRSATRCPEGLPGKPGDIMPLASQFGGEEFLALDAGPEFRFSPAISFAVQCDAQEEVDRPRTAHSERAMEMPFARVADRFGITWQVAPRRLPPVFTGPDGPGGRHVIAAMTQMRKQEIAPLQRAFDGERGRP